jgi:protein-tyrosine phosphatase
MDATAPGGATGFLNFRDLGGHATPAGRVRAGQVYRSDSLSHCDASEVAHLVGDRGIRTVVDLRHGAEIESTPLTALAEAGVQVTHVPLVDPARPDWQPMEASATLSARYQYILEHAGVEFVVALQVIAEDERRPLVFQCTAGKDRTGLLAAILLALLGVGEDAIVADYERTADAIPEMMARWQARGGIVHDPESIKPFLTAEAATIEGALRILRSEHGGVEQYVLQHGLGPQELAHLRSALVEPG